VFRRGLVEEIMLSAEQFLAHAPALAAMTPLRTAQFRPVGALLPKLAESPHLRLVPTLDFREPLKPAGLRTLLKSPHLGSTRGLILRFNALDDDSLEALAETASLAGLTTLDVHGNSMRYEPGIYAIGVDALVRSPHLTGLTTLALGDNWVGDDGAAILADGWPWPGLRRLFLGYNSITDAGARRLARCQRAADLELLDLSHNDIGMTGARAVLAALPRTVIHLRGTRMRSASCLSLRKEFGPRAVF
jgi:hypothetical protein